MTEERAPYDTSLQQPVWAVRRHGADTERTFEGVVVDAIEEFLMQATHEGRVAARTVPGYRAYWAKRGREVPKT